MHPTLRPDHLRRGPLLGLAALLLATLLLAAAGRLGGNGPDTRSPTATSPVLVERALWFQDRDDGGIDIVDARRGTRVLAIAPGSDGFLRSVVRGLARERKRAGLGPQEPFRLAAHADGRLLLSDPATGRQLALEAFGATNAAAFARLLSDPA